MLRRVLPTLLVMSSLYSFAADDRKEPAAAVPASGPGTLPVEIRVANEEFLRQYAETYRFSLGRPQRARITPDGKAVLFLRSLPRSFVMDLFEFDCQTGQERILLTAEKILAGQTEKLSAEEQAQRERLRLAARGIARYDLSEDGRTILVPLSGRLYIVDRASGASREVKSNSSAFPLDATLSPDGKQLACVRGGELLVTKLASGKEQQLTHSALGKNGKGTITNGTAEFVAQEEMDRHRGFWWSPDSRQIAYQQTDTAGMETFHISDLAHPEAEPHVWPYPRAGGKNASVRLGVIAAEGGETTWIPWNHEMYPYLVQVTWEVNCPLTILVQNRLQTEEVLYAVDPLTGATRQLLVETDPAWLNLVPGCPRWLKDGSGFLWMTERSGQWQLELRSPKGDLIRTLTPPGLGLSNLADVREESRTAYVTAGDNPTQSHLYAVSLDRGEPRQLTRQPGFQYALLAARDEPRLVYQYDLADGGSGMRVVDESWQRIGELESRAEQPLIKPRFELLKVGERQFHASIVRPKTFDASKKYPVILDVYGGPRHLSVGDTPRFYYLDQWLADQGFVVVSLDGRGTPRRGREWERAIRGNLIDIPLQDQVDGLQALGGKYPELDLSRVGVTGWSFGGYFSAMAAMRRPDVFKCAVAGAPVCDFRDYDTHYTERYLGLPQDNPRGYEESNVLTYCPALSVPLLIIHGTADDNVYFLHSLKMTEALFRAGKQFDFLPLAGFTHMVPDPQVTIRLQSRLARFFQDNLGLPAP